jgi:hypothetical protein
VDSDAIKTKLPEHRAFIEQDANSAANRLHEESSDVVVKLYERCLEQKVNIIVDGTMKDPVNADA